MTGGTDGVVAATWPMTDLPAVADRVTVVGVSVGQLLSANRFRIPMYQRYYKWRESQWEQTWGDLVEHLAAQKARPSEYHMGDMRFELCGDGVLEVADGQQRLLTLTALVAAISYCSFRVDAHLGWDASVYLIAEETTATGASRVPKVTDQADEWTLALNVIVKLPPVDALEATPIARAYGYFITEVEKELQAREPKEEKMEFLYGLVEALINRTVLTGAVYSNGVGQQSFARVHTRGARVNPQEVLKSTLISMAGNTADAGLVWQYWRSAAEVFDSERRGLTMWVATDLAEETTSLREQEALEIVLKAAKDAKDSGAGVSSIIARFKSFAASWANLRNGLRPEGGNSLPSARNITRQSPLRAQKQLFWLLPAGRHLAKGDYDIFARSVEDTIVVASVATPFPPDVERFVAGLLGRLREVASLSSPEGIAILGALKAFRDVQSQVFADRLVFGGQHEMAPKTMETVVRYLEAHAKAYLNSPNKTAAQARGDIPLGGTLEHILPQRLTDAVLEEYGDEAAAYRDRFRLGNLALIDQLPNSELSNKPYSEKLNRYANAAYRITSSLSYELAKSPGAQAALGSYLIHEATWKPDAVQRRSESLYRLACMVFDVVERTPIPRVSAKPVIFEVPQADDPAVVLTALQALKSVTTAADVAAALGYSSRQGSYYLKACEVLGLAEDNDGTWQLTVEGGAVVGSDEPTTALQQAMRDNAFLVYWAGLDPAEQVSLLEENGLATKTAKRRASTLTAWTKWAGITQ